MKKYFNTSVGRLRLLGLLEGLSLIILVFIAVPVKYLGQNPGLVKAIGPVHGVLFLLFVINTISVSISHQWKFSEVTWKVLISCLIPFGTFYVDRKILSKI